MSIGIAFDLASAAGLSLAGAAVGDFCGRMISPIVRETQEIGPARNSTLLMKGVYRIASVMTRIGGVFCSEEEGKASRWAPGVGILGGAGIAFALGSAPLVVGASALGFGALCMTDKFAEVVSGGSCVAQESVSNTVNSVRDYWKVPKKTFDDLIANCREELAGLNETPFLASSAFAAQHMNVARHDTDIALSSYLDRSSVLLSFGLFHTQVLGLEIRPGRLEIMQREESESLFDFYSRILGQDLNFFQLGMAQLWFFFAHEFVVDMVKSFSVSVLEKVREDFINSEERQIAVIKQLLRSLAGFFRENAAEEIENEADGLAIDVNGLVGSVINLCMPDLHYFKKFHEVFVVGWLFKVVDEFLNSCFQIKVKNSVIVAVQEKALELVLEFLTPEAMNPRIICCAALLVDAVKKGEDLECPLPETPGFLEMEAEISGCLDELYSWLEIQQIVPLASTPRAKNSVCRFATQELLKAVSHYGSPLEVERLILYVLQGRREEDLLDEEMERRESLEVTVKQLIEALSCSYISGNPDHVQILFKSACEKHYKIVEDCLSHLRAARDSLILTAVPSRDQIIASLKEEVGILKAFFQEAHVFAARMESLPKQYSGILRSLFFPMHQILQEQIQVLSFLQRYYEMLGRQEKRHSEIKLLMTRIDEHLENPPEGMNVFSEAIQRLACRILRRDVQEERLISEGLGHFREAPLSMKIDLKKRLFVALEKQRLEGSMAAEKKELDKPAILERAFDELFVIRTKMPKKNFPAPSRFTMMPQGMVRSFGERTINSLLSLEEKGVLCGKIQNLILSRKNHIIFSSMLIQEISNGMDFRRP